MLIYVVSRRAGTTAHTKMLQAFHDVKEALNFAKRCIPDISFGLAMPYSMTTWHNMSHDDSMVFAILGGQGSVMLASSEGHAAQINVVNLVMKNE